MTNGALEAKLQPPEESPRRWDIHFITRDRDHREDHIGQCATRRKMFKITEAFCPCSAAQALVETSTEVVLYCPKLGSLLLGQEKKMEGASSV